MKLIVLLIVLACAAWTQGQNSYAKSCIVIFDKASFQRNPIGILEWLSTTTRQLCSGVAQQADSFIVAGIRYWIGYNLEASAFNITNVTATALGGVVVPNYISLGSASRRLDSLKTIAVAPIPANCTSQQCNCCPRPITNESFHLDWLDGSLGNTSYCGPRDCDDKLDVFILSTGIDKQHVEFKNASVTVYDCQPMYPLAAPWTAANDLYGRGTYTAGLVGSKTFGSTTNVRLISIKILNDNNEGPLSSAICALEKIDSWMQANTSRKAVVLFDAQYNVAEKIPLFSTLAAAYADRLIISTFSYNCLYPSLEENIIAVGSVNRNLVIAPGVAGCIDVVEATYGVRSTLHANRTVVINETDVLPAFGQVVGVIAEYWQQDKNMTATTIRNKINATTDNDLVVNKAIIGLPAGGKKLIKYICPTGCAAAPCVAPLTCSKCCHGKSTCACPLNTSGKTCTPITCKTGATTVPHPDYCNVFLTCQNGRATRCSDEDREQRFFDEMLGRCVDESESVMTRACAPAPAC